MIINQNSWGAQLQHKIYIYLLTRILYSILFSED